MRARRLKALANKLGEQLGVTVEMRPIGLFSAPIKVMSFSDRVLIDKWLLEHSG